MHFRSMFPHAETSDAVMLPLPVDVPPLKEYPWSFAATELLLPVKKTSFWAFVPSVQA